MSSVSNPQIIELVIWELGLDTLYAPTHVVFKIAEYTMPDLDGCIQYRYIACIHYIMRHTESIYDIGLILKYYSYYSHVALMYEALCHKLLAGGFDGLTIRELSDHERREIENMPLVDAKFIVLECSLYCAVERGPIDTVRMLLNTGIPIQQIMDKEENNIAIEPMMHRAVKTGNKTLIRMLLDAGVNDTNYHGVFAACRKNDPAIVNMLASELRRKVNLVIDEGEYQYVLLDLLEYACELGLPDIVEVLIRAGVDLRSTECRALFAAAEGGHVKIILMLMQAGVMMSSNRIEYLVALENGHMLAAQILRSVMS